MKPIIKILITVQLGICGTAVAQVDPHFSQYYANPLWLNAALTGVINGDTRITANYKNQWASINNAYETGALSADFRPSDKIGLGFTVFNQSAGEGAYKHLYAYGSASYRISVSNDGNQQLSFGIQAGIINRSLNVNNLQYGNQFSPGIGYDPGLGSFENLSDGGNMVFDANAGVFFYDGNPLKNVNIFGGVSAGHLSRPLDPLYENTSTKIPVRYTLHGGVRIKAGNNIDLIPNALYIKQQEASVKAIGAYSEFKFQNDTGLILGAMYRFEDAAIAKVGYHLKNLIAGVSYDFNTSTLTPATNGQGGIEVSLSYVFKKRLQQPEPICPRL